MNTKQPVRFIRSNISGMNPDEMCSGQEIDTPVRYSRNDQTDKQDSVKRGKRKEMMKIKRAIKRIKR